MPKQKKIAKRRTVPVPRNLDEVTRFVAEIGEAKRVIEEIQAALDQGVTTLKENASGKVTPHEERIQELLEGLYVFAEANRDTLTEGGKRKTVDVQTGCFGWRVARPSVWVGNNTKAVAALKNLGLDELVRTIEEVNKEAILESPDKVKDVKGIKVRRDEEFFFTKPLTLKLEVASSVENLKMAVG